MLGNPNKTGFSPQMALSQKLKAMGISSVDSLQGTTKTIFDTAPGQGVIPVPTYRFFDQNRTLPETNFPQRFGVGEAMVIQEICFYVASPQDIANLGADTPYSVRGLNSFYESPFANFTLKLGNTNILEQVPVHGTNTSNYQQVNKVYYDPNTFELVLRDNLPFKMQLNSLIVIPPDTDLSVSIDFLEPALADTKVVCQLNGVGVELNTKF